MKLLLLRHNNSVAYSISGRLSQHLHYLTVERAQGKPVMLLLQYASRCDRRYPQSCISQLKHAVHSSTHYVPVYLFMVQLSAQSVLFAEPAPQKRHPLRKEADPLVHSAANIELLPPLHDICKPHLAIASPWLDMHHANKIKDGVKSDANYTVESNHSSAASKRAAEDRKVPETGRQADNRREYKRWQVTRS